MDEATNRRVVLDTARLIGLEIAPEHLSGAVEKFAGLMTQAALVLGAHLPDDAEPAAVFRP